MEHEYRTHDGYEDFFQATKVEVQVHAIEAADIQGKLVNDTSKNGGRGRCLNMNHGVLRKSDRLEVGGSIVWSGQDLTALTYPATLFFFGGV